MNKPQQPQRFSGMKVRSNVKAGSIRIGVYVHKDDLKTSPYLSINCD